jgi:hypothetical protein
MQVRGPGLQNLDMSLFKIFNIRESTKLEFRAEAFNVGNWVDFGNPGNLDYRNTQDFSQITGTRIAHLATRFEALLPTSTVAGKSSTNREDFPALTALFFRILTRAFGEATILNHTHFTTGGRRLGILGNF